MADVRRTACNRDCPDTCSILVTVEEGRARRLRGDPEDPVTRGFLCERTSQFLERQYAPDRLRSPLLRRRGKLVPVSWDEALDHAAAHFLRIREESGPAAILHYRSGGSLGMLKRYADHLFEQFGPVTVKRGDICSGAGEAAQELDFGICDSSDLEDLANSKLILLWGKNPHVSSPHLLPVLLEARRQGTVLVGIDVVRTRIAPLCDLFLRPRPGTDFALAMAVAQRLLERGWSDPEAPRYCDHFEEFQALARRHPFGAWVAETGLPPADVERLAELYGRTRPAALLVGWGLARRRGGATTVRALDALGAISGNLGVPGGGVSYYFARSAPFSLDFLGGLAAAPRSLPEARLGHAILAASDPPIRAIWVTAGNPLAMLPDSGSVRAAFERTEFKVVVDTHPTDTTEVADLVLPTCTLLEDDDLLGAYGNHFLHVSQPAVPPPPGVWHEYEIWQGLARRLGLEHVLPPGIPAAKQRLLRRLEPAGVGLEELEKGSVHDPLASPVLFAGRRFPTATGKVNLLTEEALRGTLVDAEFPLALHALSHAGAQSSQWIGKLARQPFTVSVHPDAAPGFREGEAARLESRRGALTVRVHLDAGVHPEVVLMPKGGMLRDQRCANLLIEALETDLGGGAVYYDQAVRLVPVPVPAGACTAGEPV